jgi:hypothetical protein
MTFGTGRLGLTLSSPQCVYVEWVDSSSIYGWRDTETAKGVSPIAVRTVGFLVNKTQGHYTVSASKSEEGHYDSPISIPRKAVTRFQTFEVPNA